jgi:hypothetical protein
MAPAPSSSGPDRRARSERASWRAGCRRTSDRRVRLDKIVFLADLATGDNWFGAIGGGIGLYFTPAIDILTGPVFFLDSDYYNATYGTDWLWSVQLDVDFDLRKKKS